MSSSDRPRIVPAPRKKTLRDLKQSPWSKLLSKVKSLDTFRTIQSGVSTSSAIGGAFTILAAVLLLSVIYLETKRYVNPEMITDATMDTQNANTIWAWFNISMHNLPCEHTSVDVKDYFGEERVNIKQNVWKADINSTTLTEISAREKISISQEAAGDDIVDDDYTPELSEDGIHHSLEITAAGLSMALRKHELIFANFYAPWCIHCQRLHPHWEKAATIMDEKLRVWRVRHKVKFASLDCVKYAQKCSMLGIRAYPTIVLYKGEEKVEMYNGPRQEAALAEYMEDRAKQYWNHDVDHVESHKHAIAGDFEGRGCRVAGFVEIPRAPGNIHIEARSEDVNVAPAMSDVSHTVHLFVFGKQPQNQHLGAFMDMGKYWGWKDSQPLDNTKWETEDAHTAPQHYLNVVGTEYTNSQGEDFSSFVKEPVYSFVASSQIVSLERDQTPEAKFAYHISPLSMRVSTERVPFYKFITSLLAILGGAYTFIMLGNEAALTISHQLFEKKGKL